MGQQHSTRVEDLLTGVPVFDALGPRSRKRIAAGATVIDAPKGTQIVRRGDDCDGFHLVLVGHVKLALHTRGGGEKVFDLVSRGETFGESAMFVGRPYRVSAEALVDSTLVHLERATVTAEIRREPLFAHAMIERLSRRLNVLIEDVEAYTLRSGTERVVLYLLQRRGGGGPADGDIVLPARKRVIASLLNLTQEHFSRILHELAAEGVISVEGAVVRILDEDRLKALVSGEPPA